MIGKQEGAHYARCNNGVKNFAVFWGASVVCAPIGLAACMPLQ
jgi:hypothetical protein